MVNYVKLGDIGDIFIGLTYKPENVSTEGMIVLRSSNIQDGELDFNDTVRVNCPVRENLLVKPNDILMCSRNGSAKLVGKCTMLPRMSEPMTFGAFMTIIRTPYNSYLRYFFDSSAFRNQIKGSATTTINQITRKMLDEIEVPVFDVESQIRITTQFEKLSKLIAMRKEQLAKLDELVKARFVEMFGDFKINPFGWPIVPFSEFAVIDGNMTTDYEKYADYPHIGIDSIEKETGELKGYRTVREDGVISGKYLFTTEHIIYSKIRPNLNKVALPDFEGLCSADAYPILPNKDNCNRIFLAVAMRSEFFLDYILQFSSRTNLPKVNRKEIAGFRMPLPPINLQKRFATFVEQTNKTKLTIQASLDKLEVMKKALMQEYFG